MKKIAIAMLVGWTLIQAQAGELQWLTDLPKAQAKAKAENKMVLLDFTGSDWCVWCTRLKNEVFSQAAFAEYASKNLVLVEVDFPHNKKMSNEQKAANDALQKQYKVEGYPTIIVLNSEGKQVGELGYMKGGPAAFIAELDKAKQKH